MKNKKPRNPCPLQKWTTEKYSQFDTSAIMMEFMIAQQVLGKTVSYCYMN